MTAANLIAMKNAQVRQSMDISVQKMTQVGLKTEATVMLHDFKKNQQAIQQAAHPYLGHRLDISI